ncbi:MAG TPA: oxygen-independent coproporphyrinogen III oxidase [Vicinamibacterales bacterium]|nr:oxygen-independent coproporphyrinogen III oxidase [Vicinamibacterales bacterium]
MQSWRGGGGPTAASRAGRLPAAELLQKYDRPAPRYTSYPTAAEFTTAFDEAAYRVHLAAAARRSTDPLSLYVHLPFCESRCSFCGCVVIATKQRRVAARYLEYLQREAAALAAALGERRRVIQLHWGGGTPTYLEPAQIARLYRTIGRHFAIDPDAEAGIEVDPRVTTREQLDLLRALGFNRLSMGVQDFTPEVQAAIRRDQREEDTRRLFQYARSAGFDSINIDLVYGLPRQTLPGFARTLDAIVELRPERAAVYAYAHVPWLRSNQRCIDPRDLPSPTSKLELFAAAIDRFLAAGYRQIGMDHFALPHDELARAAETRTLWRNFMGYTTRRAPDSVGLGISAIGDVAGAYVQNTKKLSAYYAGVDAGRLPVERGYRLTFDDRVRRYVITELMCNFYVDGLDVERRFGVVFGDYFATELAELTAPDGPAADGLAAVSPAAVEVLPPGRPFVRNICMTFDQRRRTDALDRPLFSRAI